LTEEQAIKLITGLKNPDPGFGAYDRLKGFNESAKVQKYDRVNRPIQADRTEDRDKVITAISRKKLQLDSEWEKRKKNLGMEG
jgi:hypothetical protein